MKRTPNLLHLLSTVCLITAITFLAFCLAFFDVDRLGRSKANAITSSVQPKGRVLVILIDSLQQQYMHDQEYMPFLASRLEHSAWGISSTACPPISLSCDKAIFAAYIETSVFSITDEFSQKKFTGDSLFIRLKKQNRKTAVLSRACLLSAFSNQATLASFQPSSRSFSEYDQVVQSLSTDSLKFLSSHEWDFAAIQFVGLDYAGHLHTPGSEDYKNLVRQIDRYVENFAQALGPQDTVLITSEHGMDNNGFHMDLTPSVTKTGFVLWGPDIQPGKYGPVLQIDWAPTLSILTGAPYIYNSPALPALDLLKLAPPQRENILREMSCHLTGEDTTADLAQLRSIQKKKLGINKMPLLAVTLSGLCLFTIFSICLPLCGQTLTTKTITQATTISLASTFILFLLHHFQAFDLLHARFPFRADFLIHNPFKALLVLSVLTSIPLLYLGILHPRFPSYGKTVMLIAYVSLLGSAFASNSSYHSFCWLLLAGLTAAVLYTRKISWLLLLLSMLMGLIIRRLTYLDVHFALPIPPRWVIIGTLGAVSILLLKCFGKRRRQERESIPAARLCYLAIPIFCAALPIGAALKGVFLLVWLLPIYFLFKRDRLQYFIVLAYGMTTYYLGTSSNINNLVHLIAFTMAIAIWLHPRHANTQLLLMFPLITWILYITPGNTFSFSYIDLIDPYIMSASHVHNVIPTIFLLASRYAVPVMVFLILFRMSHPKIRLFPLLMTAILPAITFLGFGLAIIMWTGAPVYPWFEVQKFWVLLIYVTTTTAIFSVASLFLLLPWNHISKWIGQGHKQLAGNTK